MRIKISAEGGRLGENFTGAGKRRVRGLGSGGMEDWVGHGGIGWGFTVQLGDIGWCWDIYEPTTPTARPSS